MFVVVYSVLDRQSFNSIRLKWITEISHHCPGVPFIIVGNKVDVPVFAREVAYEKACALGVYETSAKTGENVKSLYYYSLFWSLEGEVKRKCLIS